MFSNWRICVGFCLRPWVSCVFVCVDCVCAKMFLVMTRRYFEQFGDFPW